MLVKKMTVNPATAQKWLDSNELANRPFKRNLMLYLSRQMAKGQWVLNGESLKFGKNGELIDGQHRLQACVHSGKSFETVVVRGLDPAKAFCTVDSGQRRSLADVFAINGIESYTHVASAVRNLWVLQGGIGQLPHQTGITLLRKNQSLVETVPWLRALGLDAIAPIGLCAAVYRMAEQKDARKAEHFFERLAYGDRLKKDSPILLLRERLLEMRRKHERWHHQTLLWYICKAMRYFLAGTTFEKLELTEEDMTYEL